MLASTSSRIYIEKQMVNTWTMHLLSKCVYLQFSLKILLFHLFLCLWNELNFIHQVYLYFIIFSLLRCSWWLVVMVYLTIWIRQRHLIHWWEAGPNPDPNYPDQWMGCERQISLTVCLCLVIIHFLVLLFRVWVQVPFFITSKT